MESFLITLCVQSLKAGIVVAAILAIRFLLGKHISPTIKQSLWLFVVPAILLPIQIPIPIYETKTVTVAQTLLPVSEPVFSNNIMPLATPVSFAGPQISDVSPKPILEKPLEPETAKPSNTLTFSQVLYVLSGIWLAGFAFLFGMSLRQILRFKRRIANMQPITEMQILQLLEKCLQSIKPVMKVDLFESDRIASPLLMGIIRPKILLPENLASSLSAEQLEHLFLHELSHVKRHDIFIGWVLSFLCMIHWFNPMLWLVVRLNNNDSEEAADALALSRITPPERIEYGMTLLHLASHTSFSNLRKMPGLIGILESSSKLSRRIEMIKRHNKAWRIATIFAIGLCTLTCLGLFCKFEKVTAEESNPTTTQSEPEVKPEEKEANDFPEVDMDRKVEVRGRVIIPKGVELGRAMLRVRALSADNNQNYFGDNTDINADGKFIYTAVCNLNYEMVVYNQQGNWTSAPVYIEVGEEAPKEELAIPLVQGSTIEGTVLELETGKPMPNVTLYFAQYFETTSKTDGKPRILPIGHFINTDENGVFRQTALPGEYGIAFGDQAESLFFEPTQGYPENFLINNWSDNKESLFTAFTVKENETVKPILRISKETNEKAAKTRVDMDRKVEVRGRVIIPKGVELGRIHLNIRALSSDNEQNYFGDGCNLMSDGTFIFHATCNLNYEMVARCEFGNWTSKPVYLEIGNEAPKEELIIPLVECAQQVEGTVLNQKTGEPMKGATLFFFQYFEATSKKDGKQRIFPLADGIMTDDNGKFHVAVLPGQYGVAVEPAIMRLFFNPARGFPKNFWTANWDENKETRFTAFQVKENETVKPILRVTYESGDVKKPIEIRGRIVAPDGKLPEKMFLPIRVLSENNDTNMYTTGGKINEDGSFLVRDFAHQNYELVVYDKANQLAAKPISIEVKDDSPQDEFTITMEKGTLIEGTVLNLETGKPVPDLKLTFYEYFEVKSKSSGKTRTFPINSPLKTDENGKFRRMVLAGKFGVATEPVVDLLFMPDTTEKATVRDFADWQKNEERPATVFEIKKGDKTIRPILRIKE